MAVNRRIGAESSATRGWLMDAVETIMREEGYAALTARRVAERADLKHQLVFYYFENMDELLLATYRRHIERYRETMERTFASDRPLHAFWAANSNPHDAVLNAEFLAMSNHNEAVRAETIRFGEEFRRAMATLPLAREAYGKPISSAAAMMMINFVGSLLGLEAAIGISGVHAEIRALVDWCVDQLEPNSGYDETA
jgi:AcrR family transcriptional regulator